MNEVYQIHSIGMVVFLFLLSGIPWTIYSIMYPDSLLKRMMLIIIVTVMVIFIAIKAIPLEIKFNYIYPLLGGFFLPDFFSTILKKISNKLRENAEEPEKEREQQQYYDEDEQQEEEDAEIRRTERKEKIRKKEKQDNVFENENSNSEKEFVTASDEVLEKRKRIKRKTPRTREINIDE